MNLKIDAIRRIVAKIPFIKQIYEIEKGEFYITGKVEIAFDELDGSLDFDFEIAPQYPFKTFESESITFRNKDLIPYNHVMAAGNICIHTSHCTDLEQKLQIDFNSLKEWIIKYYINKNKDSNYEHIIVNNNPINDKYFAYSFTESENSFKKGEYGDVPLSFLNTGIYKEKIILNFITQGFKPVGGNYNKCLWSSTYEKMPPVRSGLYYFVDEIPAIYSRFSYKKWKEFSRLISTDFLNLLNKLEEQNFPKHKGDIVPLFLGYRINQAEIHWQVSLLEIGTFPLTGTPEKVNGIKTGTWNSEFVDEEINWGITKNTSYKYFFGRGTFCKELTTKKILIVGVGAIGSMIATTLTRGGCRYIDFVDYDVKEPENVCRSEYMFLNGITNKTEELEKILSAISPFVNINHLDNNYFERIVKSHRDDITYREKFTEEFNNYDLIFDCSTDNDLMYVLNTLNLKTELINISITNHAKELVCAFYPNIYHFVNNQFANVLKNDVDDLYSPTGCWSPTFKASYNDINVLVQLSLRQINMLFQKKGKKNNFVIQEENTDLGNLKIVEF